MRRPAAVPSGGAAPSPASRRRDARRRTGVVSRFLPHSPTGGCASSPRTRSGVSWHPPRGGTSTRSRSWSSSVGAPPRSECGDPEQTASPAPGSLEDGGDTVDVSPPFRAPGARHASFMQLRRAGAAHVVVYQNRGEASWHTAPLLNARDGAGRCGTSRRTRRRLIVSPGRERGWLAFTSATEKRLLLPVPEGWERLDDAQLEALCARAVCARPRPGRWRGGR